MSGHCAYTNVDVKDATYKVKAYLLRMSDDGNMAKADRLVRLAFETFLKFADSEEFLKDTFERTHSLLLCSPSFSLLFFLDQLLKNNRWILRTVKRDIDRFFRLVWEKTWNYKNNSTRLYTLLIMLRVWRVLYGEKLEDPIRKWIYNRYGHHTTMLSSYCKAQIAYAYDLDSRSYRHFNYLVDIIDEPTPSNINHYHTLYYQFYLDS